MGMLGIVKRCGGNLREAWGGAPDAHPLLLSLLDGGDLLCYHR